MMKVCGLRWLVLGSACLATGCDQMWIQDGGDGEFLEVYASITADSAAVLDYVNSPPLLGVVWFPPELHPVHRSTQLQSEPPIAAELQGPWSSASLHASPDYDPTVTVPYLLHHAPDPRTLSPWKDVNELVDLEALAAEFDRYEGYVCALGSMVLVETTRTPAIDDETVPFVANPEHPTAPNLVGYSGELLVFCRDLDNTHPAGWVTSTVSDVWGSAEEYRAMCLRLHAVTDGDWRRCESEYEATRVGRRRYQAAGLVNSYHSVNSYPNDLPTIYTRFEIDDAPNSMAVTEAYRLACPVLHPPQTPANACDGSDPQHLVCSGDGSLAVWQHRPPPVDPAACVIHPPIYCQAERNDPNFPSACSEE